MGRPTNIHIDSSALLHNVNRVREYAPGKKIIAMVKANAYGCGLSSVIPTLEGRVDAFGVACLEEAIILRKLGSRSDCILFQGIFTQDELSLLNQLNVQCVIHQKQQLQWLLATPLDRPVKIWVKINTGMHRLGFAPHEVSEVIHALRACAWVHEEIGLMTHLANADEVKNPSNDFQLQRFITATSQLPGRFIKSIANSAAIVSFPESHADVVRPGIMLYGISPFPNQTGLELGLKPVMRFTSSLSTIHHYPPDSPVGYGGIWKSGKPSTIGVVPAGYGDGYPRHIKEANVWLNGILAPVVGRISMDMLTIDLTHCPKMKEGDMVELWGPHIPIESVAHSAGTIAYELLTQVTNRPRAD
ncbi:alanine racemase [Legionella londiniensis]|uniref:Alanine racemase n=1 Tax=Legionella londiniensis TaxID=45068 RepID=A0A0W0VKV0_9GAMM|nr:alanine racemase [Legionella londiniensis]KTD20732.1 alanine racemase [Legionella londiniensis]STX92795.1 alanine racemase [Legionella londiniensis]